MKGLACPPDEEILPLCGNGEADPAVREHVSGCSDCRQRLESLRRVLAVLREFNRRKELTIQRRDPDSTEPMAPPRPAIPSQQPPERIGAYRVDEILGSGGQADVFLARNRLSRQVVLKMARRGGNDKARRAALIAEGKVLAQISHPNVVRVLDLDFHEDRPFLVMEHIAGRNLSQYRGQVKLTAPQMAALLAKAARGVGAAHRCGVVHQDLKPENIVIDERDEPRVIDFGMARVLNAWETNAEMVGGTAQFMAPEQAAEFLNRRERGTVDPRRDVFALGAVLYYLLTGQAPFCGGTSHERLEAAADCKLDSTLLDRPGIDRTLARICRKAISADPEQRYATADALANALERRANPPWRRWAAVACAAAILALLTLAWRPWRDGRSSIGTPPERQFLVESIGRGTRDGDPLTPKSVEDLGKRLPLRTTDRVSFRCQIPNGFHAAAFLVRSDGRVRPLEGDDSTAAAGATEYFFRFPSQGAWKLDGDEGNVLVLVCASPDKPPTADTIASAAAALRQHGWVEANLPTRTLLLLKRSDVEPLHVDEPRGIEQTSFRQVSDGVEEFRRKLLDQGDQFLFWGLVVHCVVPSQD